MCKALIGLLMAIGLGAAGAAMAAPLPKPVADIIEAVADDPAALKTVVSAAKKSNPDSIAEIDAQVAAIAVRNEAARTARLASLDPLEGWTGEIEFGGFYLTGNTDENGYTAGLTLSKDTLRLRHTLEVLADYKKADDEISKERYVGTYMGYYKLGERHYAWGRLAYEYDRIAGFDNRLSESVGLGYRVINARRLKWDLEAGGALRQTEFSDDTHRSSVAARVAGRIVWDIRPNAKFTQNAAAFLEDGNNTLTATSAFTTKVLDTISARASLDVRYDENPPRDRENTDTTTRVTLVYEF